MSFSMENMLNNISESTSTLGNDKIDVWMCLRRNNWILMINPHDPWVRRLTIRKSSSTLFGEFNKKIGSHTVSFGPECRPCLLGIAHY